MIRIVDSDAGIELHADAGELAARTRSQLAFWGFIENEHGQVYILAGPKAREVLPKLVSYMGAAGLEFCVSDEAKAALARHAHAEEVVAEAVRAGRAFKQGALNGAELAETVRFLRTGLPRPLKPHQVKAATHLLLTKNAANFSVPGSGKTTVVLAVFDRLRDLGEIDALFVVGPPACFAPWRNEYGATLGTEPNCQIMAGGDIGERRSRYRIHRNDVADLYLTTFQTLQRDWRDVRVLFSRHGIRFLLVVDEAHYIKQNDGAWAKAVLDVARHAARRCVLTGTPFPRSYVDGFNLFDVLWPEASPLPSAARQQISLQVQRGELDRAADVMRQHVGPLFYRVRKTDLGLAPQIVEPVTLVPMRQYERLIYDAVVQRVRDASMSDYFRNEDLLLRLRRGRMMRIRQCVSYAPLLASAIPEYCEDLLSAEPTLADLIMHYDELETPGKLSEILRLVTGLVAQGEKVVVWSNFVRTLERIAGALVAVRIGVRLIYGATPIHRNTFADEQTREEIIAEFVDPSSSVSVLIANPAACAESVSLHKTCSHAIYYDLSYNCAQYLQSMDRIHRVGGSERKPAHYHFLQYEDTIDQDILLNVQAKAANMAQIVDQDYPVYSLDMFSEDEEVEAYGRVFRCPIERV